MNPAYGRSKPSWETIGGKRYYFRSGFEIRWAKYLEILKTAGEIRDWYYETRTFYFLGETRGAVQYTPDFEIIERDGTIVYQETKGIHTGKTNTKLRRLKQHYPDVNIELVRQSMPKNRRTQSKEANAIRIASKYCRDNRVIDGGAILKQVGL